MPNIELIPNDDIVSMEELYPTDKAEATLFNQKFRNLLGNDARLKLYIESIRDNAKDYADTLIADLIGLAPEAKDTIYELANAVTNNEDLITVLSDAISNKADQTDLENLESRVLSTTTHEIVLNASDWVGDTAPYSITVAGEFSNVNTIDVLPNNFSLPEFKVCSNACIICGNISNTGTVTLFAYGEKPSIDIPVIFKVM